jgi:cell division protein FtsB
MNKYTKRGTIHTRNWIILIILFGLMILFTKSLFGAAKNIRVSNQNLQDVEKEYQSLYERGKDIEHLLTNFEDDFGFERYVRENFGVSKPGEKVVIIVNHENKDDEPREGEIGQDSEND